MNRISLAEAETEAAGSWQDLEHEIGAILPIFAYPGGGLNHKVAQVIREAGFAVAFTTWQGINSLRTADRFELRRINATQNTPLTVVRLRLLPWSVYFNRWRALPGM